MPTFSSLSSLSRYIDKQVEETVRDDLAKNNSKILKESKQKNVYDAYNPTEYERTFEFLNSNPSVFTQLKNNMELVTYTETASFFMPSGHPSWATGENMNDAIPHFMQFGNGGSTLFSYSGRPYIEDAIENVDRTKKQVMVQGLKKRGIDAR